MSKLIEGVTQEAVVECLSVEVERQRTEDHEAATGDRRDVGSG